jgi:hypothetical protein
VFIYWNIPYPRSGGAGERWEYNPMFFGGYNKGKRRRRIIGKKKEKRKKKERTKKKETPSSPYRTFTMSSWTSGTGA